MHAASVVCLHNCHLLCALFLSCVAGYVTATFPLQETVQDWLVEVCRRSVTSNAV